MAASIVNGIGGHFNTLARLTTGYLAERYLQPEKDGHRRLRLHFDIIPYTLSAVCSAQHQGGTAVHVVDEDVTLTKRTSVGGTQHRMLCMPPTLVRLVRVTCSSTTCTSLVLRGAHRRQSIRYNVRMQPQSAVAILLLLHGK